MLLAITGMGLGFLGTWVTAEGHDFGPIADIFTGLDRLEVATDIFLPLFLPPLLFTAGLTIDVRRLLDEVFAVAACWRSGRCWSASSSSPAQMHLATGKDIAVCLLLGAIVATTDPAAVIGIFRDASAPPSLAVDPGRGQNSLFNDAWSPSPRSASSSAAWCCARAAMPTSSIRSVAGDVTNPLIAFAHRFLGGICVRASAWRAWRC